MALPLVPIAAGMCAPGCATAAAAAATAVGGGALLTTAAPVLAVGAGAAAMYNYMKGDGKGGTEAENDDGDAEFFDPIGGDDESVEAEGETQNSGTATGDKQGQPMAGVGKKGVGIKIHGLHASRNQEGKDAQVEDANATAEGKKIAAAFF
ncbi:unnamed protein product [Amoebophrya sp. A25]|nr:unnamed protein product [Amoebophrya sp. A25]|eukprot:GSA25T00008331001.1